MFMLIFLFLRMLKVVLNTIFLDIIAKYIYQVLITNLYLVLYFSSKYNILMVSRKTQLNSISKVPNQNKFMFNTMYRTNNFIISYLFKKNVNADSDIGYIQFYSTLTTIHLKVIGFHFNTYICQRVIQKLIMYSM